MVPRSPQPLGVNTRAGLAGSMFKRILETDQSEGVHNEKYVKAIYDASDSMLKTLGY